MDRDYDDDRDAELAARELAKRIETMYRKANRRAVRKKVVNLSAHFDVLRCSVPGMLPRRRLPPAIEFIRQSRLRSSKPSAPRRAV